MSDRKDKLAGRSLVFKARQRLASPNKNIIIPNMIPMIDSEDILEEAIRV